MKIHEEKMNSQKYIHARTYIMHIRVHTSTHNTRNSGEIPTLLQYEHRRSV